MRPLRVALVGCGIISEAHVRAYGRQADRARITVCCDLDPARAAERAEQAGGARVAADYRAVLDDPEVDAVELCTPHHLHAEAAVAAARAGKQILCQKPLANTLDECDAMIAAAREAGVTLFYGEINRTQPAAIGMRRAIEAGRIGRLVGVQGTYSQWQGGRYLETAWRYDAALSGGGQLLDGGIHFLDLMLQTAGPARSVSCFTSLIRPALGPEDTAVVNIRFAGGALGTLFSSHSVGIWYPYSSFAAFGTEGVLTLGGTHGALTLHRPDLPDRREVLIAEREDPFEAMIGRYLDTVVDGAPNLSPGEVGRENLRLALAAYDSARQGQEIVLD